MRNGVRAGEESAADFASGGIAMRVENTGAAVSGFAGESEFGAGAIEFSAPFDKLGDVLRTFFNQERDGFRAAQAVTGRERVLLVETNFVLIAECYSDAALRPGCGGITESGFCEDQNGAGGAEFDGSAQTGDARAYDGVIGMIDLWRGGHGKLSQ